MRRADSGRTARESSASGLLAGKSLPGDKRFLPTLASADFESGPPGSYTNAAAPGGTSFGPQGAFPLISPGPLTMLAGQARLSLGRLCLGWARSSRPP